MQVSTLRPGLLVSLKTSVSGNVAYKRLDIEAAHRTDDGIEVAKWETERTTEDPEEFAQATEIRTKCSGLIRKVCSPSMFGLLCPEMSQDQLNDAIESAQMLCADFNRIAKLTRVGIYVIVGRIAEDDVQAVKAINSEVRDLLTEMEEGLQRLDVKAVREAYGKAKKLGQMLSPNAAARVQLAIDAARDVTKRMVAAGEEAALELDNATLQRIRESRTAFLDMDDGTEVSAPDAVGRGLDLAPEGNVVPMVAQPRQIEL